MTTYTYITQLTRAGLILLILSFTACVTELETPLDLAPQLVINGQFNNSSGQRQLSVLLVDKLDGKGTNLDATGSIYKDGQLSVALIPNTEGDLELPNTYQIEEGAEYFVEIVLEQNQIYRSSPQVVQPKYKTNDLSFVVEEDIESPRFTGITINRSTIEFFAHVILPDPEIDKRYYRWVVDEAWNFIESNKEDTCYLSNTIFDNSASVLTNATGFLESGEARISVLKRKLDKSFAYTHFINIYLHSLDKKTYNFYEKAERLTSVAGTIYDEVPGPFRGNVSNTSDPEEVVLGWVEFFLSDTLRYKLQRDFIDYTVPTQCDDVRGGGPCPPQLPPPGGGLPTPCQCNACWAVLGIDALIPPDYWED